MFFKFSLYTIAHATRNIAAPSNGAAFHTHEGDEKMIKAKTEKRLKTAIQSVSDLHSYLERALRKLNEEGEVSPAEQPEMSKLKFWLKEQSALYARRRNAEAKTSESYRFFDGKSQGFESVLRFIDELAGESPRDVSNKGYLSGRDTASEVKVVNMA